MTHYSSPSDDVLGTFDATEVAHMIERGSISAVEAAEAAIRRVEDANLQTNSISTPDFDRAIDRAQAIQEQKMWEKPGYIFAGVPTMIKETDAVRGLPLSFGSHAMPKTPMRTSSAFVEQFEAMGVNALGTTTMPEFGLTGTTESQKHGATRNPWDLSKSTGGSSGGAAALVASGALPFAHANDGGGSIRIPASCCGLVGFKPSQGRVKTATLPPVMPMNIIHQGVLSRSVRDSAAFLFAAEQQAPAVGLSTLGHVTEPLKRRLRVGVFYESNEGVIADSACVAGTLKSAKLLEDLGHQVDIISNPFPRHLNDAFLTLWATVPALLWHFGGYEFGSEFDRSQFSAWTQYLQRHFYKNMHNVPIHWSQLKVFQKRYDSFLNGFDVLLCPTTGTSAPEIGYLGPEVDGDTHYHRLKHFTPFTPFQNISGTPALSLPMAQTQDGFPLGMQFAARNGEDKLLLELALQIEEASPWHTLAS